MATSPESSVNKQDNEGYVIVNLTQEDEKGKTS